MNRVEPRVFACYMEEDIAFRIVEGTKDDTSLLSDIFNKCKVNIFQFAHIFNRPEVSINFQENSARFIYLRTLHWNLPAKKLICYANSLPAVSDTDVLTKIDKIVSLSKKHIKKKYSKSLEERLKTNLTLELV